MDEKPPLRIEENTTEVLPCSGRTYFTPGVTSVTDWSDFPEMTQAQRPDSA